VTPRVNAKLDALRLAMTRLTPAIRVTPKGFMSVSRNVGPLDTLGRLCSGCGHAVMAGTSLIDVSLCASCKHMLDPRPAA
jgi:hypothetical protein